MLFREMLETDLSQICIIEQETFTAPWSYDDFQKALKDKNNGYFVMVDDNKVIGYCGYWGIAGEGNIYNVAVKKEYRGQQIGYRMLTEMIKEGYSRGMSAYTLEVRYSNEAAIKLYKRLGFESAGIRKDFYTDPKEDAVIMWLNPIQ